jgi:hypothetical protein
MGIESFMEEQNHNGTIIIADEFSEINEIFRGHFKFPACYARVSVDDKRTLIEIFGRTKAHDD